MSVKSKNNFLGKIIILIWIVLLVLSLCGLIVEASGETGEALTPTKEQYLELKAIRIEEATDGSKQVLMQLWGYKLEFGGFDVRFHYDKTALQLSNIEDNTPVSNPNEDEAKYFKWEEEFKDKLELDNMGDIEVKDNIIRAVVSFARRFFSRFNTNSTK